jgi:hypothetical protein
MQNMGKFGICRDYGLMARLHLQKTESGRLVVRAVETIAVTDMHERPRRLSAASGRQHIYVLNHLAGQYDDARRGMKGVRFSPQADGTGLYCAPGAERLPGRIGDLCRARELPTAPSLALTRRIRGACGAR